MTTTILARISGRRAELTALALAGAFTLAQAGAAEALTLRIGDYVAPGSVQAQAADRFAATVNASNVDLEVQTFHGSQLGTGPVMVENVGLGVQEMFIGGLAFFADFSNDLRIAETPFTFASREHFEAWLTSPAFEKTMADVVANANQRFINLGVLWRRGPFRVMLATRPVLTPEDFASIRLRLWEAEVAHRFHAQCLGATAVTIPFGDVYVALRQGVVEAVTSPFDLAFAQKFHEVAPHVMITQTFWQAVPMSINEDIWQSLTEEQQRVLVEAADEAGTWFNEEVARQVDSWRAEMEAAGATFYEVDRAPFVAKVTECNRRWSEEGYWREGLIEEIQALAQ
jgi:TRAP-type transport system periplasmic protein